VHGVVDEIVVADTGSSDASVEIARAAGAKVDLNILGRRFREGAQSFPCRGHIRLGADAGH
jgi:glycosyltransferase involved in cell wall biosynthesis